MQTGFRRRPDVVMVLVLPERWAAAHRQCWSGCVVEPVFGDDLANDVPEVFGHVADACLRGMPCRQTCAHLHHLRIADNHVVP